ncbi:hypothetical protein [Paenibacillus sp. IITD108]|uniref:hypothetical protein n=1 Tax=Paenibacillus sp. IITD108 TaxID=3116649 RepID=UPI002F3FFE74
MKTNKHKLIFGSIFIVVALILTLQSAMATTYSGGRGGAKFKAYYTNSVSSYGYTPHFDAARANWNATSSKVDITTQSNENNYPDKYYVGVADSEPGYCYLGQLTPWKSAGGTIMQAGLSDLWLYSTVTIYHNGMEDCDMNYNQRVSNATHEVGHSLSMAHPSGTTVSSVMHQGIQSIGPSTYDKNEIIAKWGP